MVTKISTFDYDHPRFQELLSDLSIESEVVEQFGPDNGAPVIKYEGSEEAIQTLEDSFDQSKGYILARGK